MTTLLGGENRRSRGNQVRKGRQLGGYVVLDSEDGARALQPVWFELRERKWNTLAVVPVGPGQATAEVAKGIADVARSFEGLEIEVWDAAGASIEEVRGVLREIESKAPGKQRVIIALDSPEIEPSTLPLCRAADAAVLLVTLEHSTMRDARTVVSKVGEDKFVGGVTLRLSKGRRPRARRGVPSSTGARRSATGTRVSAGSHAAGSPVKAGSRTTSAAVTSGAKAAAVPRTNGGSKQGEPA